MPSVRIQIAKTAKRELRKLDPDIRSQIADSIDRLGRDPYPPSARPLKGNYEGYWRERSGNYRIIYQVLADRSILRIIRVGHRKDIYR